MKYKQLGTTGVSLSAVTLGTWGIGGAGWNGARRDTSIETIREMIGRGVNSIDTAPVYGFYDPQQEDLGFGYAERLVGEALRGRRDSVFLTSKCGLNYDRAAGPRSLYKSMSKAEIVGGCEASLRRLGTDHLDLLLIHWPDGKTPFEEAAAALESLRAAGKVRWIGLSNFSAEDTLAFDRLLHVDAVQLPYSMIERSAQDSLRRLHAAGIGTMTYGSLGAGILTGAYRTMPTLSAMDIRKSFYRYFEEPAFSQVQALLRVMDTIAAAHGVPLTQVALAWSTAHDFVDTVVIGVSKPKHAAALDGLYAWQLDAGELRRLDAEIKAILPQDGEKEEKE